MCFKKQNTKPAFYQVTTVFRGKRTDYEVPTLKQAKEVFFEQVAEARKRSKYMAFVMSMYYIENESSKLLMNYNRNEHQDYYQDLIPTHIN